MKKLVKKLSAVLIFAALSSFVFGQENQIEDSDKTVSQTEKYELSNSIPVYYKKNTNNQIDTIYIGVKGGVLNYPAQLSGIEKAVFQMMQRGSKNYTSENIKTFVYETSSGFGSGSGISGSVLYLNCIDDYIKNALPYLLDGFVNPAFDEKEYGKLINEFENQIQQTMNDPYSIGQDFLIKKVYSDHPYGTFAYPTAESIQNLTLSAIKEHHQQIMDASRIYVVAVTKTDISDILPELEKYLGGIKTGNGCVQMEIPAVSVKSKPMVLSHDAASGTGFIGRTFAAPSRTDSDYIPFIMAESIYDKVLHNVVREKYGMCYSAWCDDLGRVANIGYEVLYRCSDFTDLKERLGEARKIMSDGKYITGTNEDGTFILADISVNFESFRNAEINKIYTSEMTTSSIGAKISNSILLYGRTDGIDLQREKLNTVTAEEVISAFNKYFITDDDFWIGVAGPEDEEKLIEILK